MIRKFFTLSFIIMVLSWTNCSNQDQSIISIGAVLPLTGNIAQYGEYMKQGIELAIEDALKAGLIQKNECRIFIEDAQADPRKSVDAFKKLINVNNIIGCIPATSGVTLAMMPIANSNNVVLINASAISTQIDEAPDYVFSVLPNAGFEGKYLAEISYDELDKRNASVIFRNDQSGNSFKENYVEKFKELGGNVLYVDGHEPNINDFRPYISKIKIYDNIDVIFVASWGPEVATFAKQAAELGLNKQIITYETFNSPEVLRIAGESANGVVFCAPEFDENSEEPRIASLREKVKKKYGQDEMNYYIASHYDAMMLMLEGINSGAKTGEGMRTYIEGLNQYSGVTGIIKFDENGGASLPLGLYTVKQNKFVQY